MLIGRNGQVGWELQRTLAPVGEVIALNRRQMEFTRPAQICERVRDIKPDLIINTAAYTAVDKAEEEADLARAVNGTAPGILAEEAKRINAILIHYSTDYVFDGAKKSPYTEEDLPNPLSIYAMSKLEGEQAVRAVGVPHLILRVSGVYGVRRKNFMLTVLRLAKEGQLLRVVNDQISCPTWDRMIAEATAQIIAQGYPALIEKGGTYHLSGGKKASWYDFARGILDRFYGPGLYPVKLVPISTAEYSAPVRRPAFSALSNEKLRKTFGLAMPHWDTALDLLIDGLDRNSAL